MAMTEEQWEEFDGECRKFGAGPRGTTALGVQVGGGHYKGFAIQPFEYNQKNGLPFGEACIVKYVSRHQSKNGIEDLRKARHFLELIALITYGEEL